MIGESHKFHRKVPHAEELDVVGEAEQQYFTAFPVGGETRLVKTLNLEIMEHISVL